MKFRSLIEILSTWRT